MTFFSPHIGLESLLGRHIFAFFFPQKGRERAAKKRTFLFSRPTSVMWTRTGTEQGGPPCNAILIKGHQDRLQVGFESTRRQGKALSRRTHSPPPNLFLRGAFLVLMGQASQGWLGCWLAVQQQ